MLFLTFQDTYGIPLPQITMLVTINFGLQLLVDLVSVGFVDKIGCRASMVIAHICAAAGTGGIVHKQIFTYEQFLRTGRMSE